MEERKYLINMHTPIGVRRGVLFATIKQDRISGTINILERTEAFEGIIEEDGHCVIKGNIISLMKTIEYVATGRFTEDDVSLRLKDKKSTFMIYGVASLTEGDKIYEQVL